MVSSVIWDTVIFDWDGTLVNSVEAIVTCFDFACAAMDLPVVDHDFLRAGIGLTFDQQLMRVFPGLQIDAATFKEHYYECYHRLGILASDALIPGVMGVLKELHLQGLRLAIATGKVRKDLDRALQAHGIAHYFSASVAGDEAPSKPDSTMIHMLLERLDLEPDQALMVGDNGVDILAARGARVESVAVLTGVQQDFSDENPLAVLNSVVDLWSFMCSGEGMA